MLINSAVRSVVLSLMIVFGASLFEASTAPAQSNQPQSRKYQEPQHVTPEVDQLFLQSIGLRSANTVASAVSDGEFNILLVGKDFQGGAEARVEALRAGHLEHVAFNCFHIQPPLGSCDILRPRRDRRLVQASSIVLHKFLRLPYASML